MLRYTQRRGGCPCVGSLLYFYVVYGSLFAPLKSYSLRIAVFSLAKLYLPPKRSCAVVADVLCNCGHGYHLLCRYCTPVVILRQSMKNLYSFYVKQKAILCKERRNVKVQIHGIILAWCKVSILLVYPTFTRTYGKM